jgi:uncharacterized membrane-anchored protein
VHGSRNGGPEYLALEACKCLAAVAVVGVISLLLSGVVFGAVIAMIYLFSY